VVKDLTGRVLHLGLGAGAHLAVHNRRPHHYQPPARHPRRDDPLATLSARGREVLAPVAEGLSHKEIAARLLVTERTAEAHISFVFATLGLLDDPSSHRRDLAVLTYLRT
jgi:DNA-binding NarL/FixJ family response regulator